MLGTLFRGLKRRGRPALDLDPVASAAIAGAPGDKAEKRPGAASAAAGQADLNQASSAAEARGDLAAAEGLLRTWVAEQPDNVAALANLGGLLIRHERWAEAEQVLAPALQRFPAALPLLMNIGILYQGSMRLDQAINVFRLALAVDPGYAAARFQLATALFLRGEYREGFLLFRARQALGAGGAPSWLAQIPRWEGEPLQGKRLLVWLDWGGLGDEIQFARFLTLLKQAHPRALICLGCTPASQRLLAGLPAVDHTFSSSCELAIDYCVPLLDLPCMFGTSVNTIPSPGRYLAANEGDRQVWAGRLAGLAGRKVGLCWTSGFWGRSQRSPKSIPLALLAPLREVPGLKFFSLQKGPALGDIAGAGLPMHDYDAALGDLADTAALIENLDLVISVDTVVAHLAGALGKPVIMLLRAESGNFWLLDTERSPWYASMRIVRQSREHEWADVAQKTLQLVRDWARGVSV